MAILGPDDWNDDSWSLLSRGTKAWHYLRPFVPPLQAAAILEGVKGEEHKFFLAKIIELADRIKGMPRAGDGGEDAPIAYLHYFGAPVDAYVTELDMLPEQSQAFGLQDAGGGAVFGYIDLSGLVQRKVELDLHFRPTPAMPLLQELQRDQLRTTQPATTHRAGRTIH